MGALAAVGKLRERLSAVRNLQHLVGSRTVGPRVLAQVIPEVNSTLSEWRGTTTELASHVGDILSASRSELECLFSLDGDSIEALGLILASVENRPVAAKSRLNVERGLRKHLPAIAQSVAHWELLVEATRANSVPMSVEELLSSRPDGGSGEPTRSVSVVGAAEVEVAVPVRAALRCLGALASAYHSPLAVLYLNVRLVPGGVELIFTEQSPTLAPVFVSELPLFSPTPMTCDVIRCALRPFSGEIGEGMGSVRLPRCLS